MNAECAIVSARGRSGAGTAASACCVAPDAIPFENGCTNRWGMADAATSDWIWLWKIAPSAAMPVAIPTWRNVLLMPEAIPARRGSTTLTDVEASGALTSPIPMPPTMKPASSVVHVERESDPVHEQERDADHREPAAEQELDGDPGREPPCDRRDDERDEGERQEDHACLDRRVAEHVLEVERQEEELREHPRRHREGRDLRAGEGRHAEEPDVEHRGPRAQARSPRRRREVRLLRRRGR